LSEQVGFHFASFDIAFADDSLCDFNILEKWRIDDEVLLRRDIEDLIDASGGLCSCQIWFLQFFWICFTVQIEPDWKCPGITLI
jgi:hypothetical protein